VSETGAEGLGGFHADSATRWSEEFQEWYYKEQVAMLKKMPANFMAFHHGYSQTSVHHAGTTLLPGRLEQQGTD